MEEYLYQKEYVMLNNMQLHLSNPEPMLKYIDEKVEKLIKAKSKNEEINIKLEILDEFYKILKYDAKNTICPEPLGHFETKEEKDELIKKKIKINDLVYYLGNICINYHKKLISKEYRGRVPIITNEATIKFNEIYIRALNEYFETLKGNEYKGIFENPPKKQQNLQIIRMIEYSGVVFPMAEPLTNNKIECIRDEHAYGTAFILPTLIERFLIIQLDSKILKNLMKELKDKIEKENIKLTDEEKQYYNIITEKGDKTIFASEKFIRANIYKMFIKYHIINEEDEDIKLLILHEYIKKKDNKKIQDAHEAIRPTDIALSPVVIKESLSRDQFRLYQLIWKRFTASQMSPAVYETISVKIAAGKYRFTVAASKVKFEGFLSVYKDNEEKEASNALVKGIDEQSELTLNELNPQQHFTQPPAHYTEASLVKTLEELGIGRPSTYAPTITTIIARHYVAKENKNLYVTELGEAVNNIMKKAFPSIVDVNFTANMESLLDGVEEGSVKWKEVIRNFYPDLNEAVKAAEKELESVKIEDEVTDEICEVCGRNMVIKYGPHGKFLACPGFPECRNTKPYYEKIGVACPKCGKDVVIKMTRKGRRYYGCIDYPECDFMSWGRPVEKKCPRCGGYMVEKGNKLACADEHCGYTEAKEKETE